MFITKDFIKKGATYQNGENCCGWNSKQIRCLGLKWPPKKGWIVRMDGKCISDKKADKFLKLRGTPKTPNEKTTSRKVSEFSVIDDADIFSNSPMKSKSQLENEFPDRMPF